MNMTKTMTCIVCPMGCQIDIELDEGKNILSIKGNTCKRGEAYVREEMSDPKRTLTSTVRITGAKYDVYLPVKTDGGIPKSKLFAAMEELSKITVKVPVKRGDVIVDDLLGTGVALVAGKTVEE